MSKSSKAKWPRGTVLFVEVYETERKWPLTGWSGEKRLPSDRYRFSSADGVAERQLKDVEAELPTTHAKWITGWEMYSGESSNGVLPSTRFDAEGWEYAVDMPRSHHPKSKMSDFVRRRIWRRAFLVTVANDVSVPFPPSFKLVLNTALAMQPDYDNSVVQGPRGAVLEVPDSEQGVPASQEQNEGNSDVNVINFIEVYETERKWPASGWSGVKRMPTDRYRFATADGAVERQLKDVDAELPTSHAKWVTHWERYSGEASRGVLPSDRFDANGWEYAVDMPRSHHPKYGMMDFTRRRIWRRAFTVTVADAASVPFPPKFKLIMNSSQTSLADFNSTVVKDAEWTECGDDTNDVPVEEQPVQEEEVITQEAEPTVAEAPEPIVEGPAGVVEESSSVPEEAAGEEVKEQEEVQVTVEAPINLNGFCFIEVYETERKWPGTGWSGVKRLPTDRYRYASANGADERLFTIIDDGLPTSHAKWVSGWEVYAGESSNGVLPSTRFDAEGWEYAVDMPRSHHPNNKITDFTRRRIWRRAFQVTVPSDVYLPFRPNFRIMIDSSLPNLAAFDATVVKGPREETSAKVQEVQPQPDVIHVQAIEKTTSEEQTGRSEIESEHTAGLDALAQSVKDDEPKPTATPTATPAAGRLPGTLSAQAPKWPKGIALFVEVYETERKWPVIGWSEKRLPTDRYRFATADGTVERLLKDVGAELPTTHASWLTEWELYSGESSRGVLPSDRFDADGWEYAVDMPMAYHQECSMTDFVRRRIWRRAFLVKVANNVTIPFPPSFKLVLNIALAKQYEYDRTVVLGSDYMLSSSTNGDASSPATNHGDEGSHEPAAQSKPTKEDTSLCSCAIQ